MVGGMRSLKVYSARWYPGHDLLVSAVEVVRERLGDEFPVEVVLVDDALVEAEQQKISTVPTVVLFKDGESVRRISGAVGLPEIFGLSGVKSRARVIPKSAG